MGLKHFDSIEHIKTWNKYTKTYKPNMKKHNLYAIHLLNFINAYYRLEKSDYSQKSKGD